MSMTTADLMTLANKLKGAEDTFKVLVHHGMTDQQQYGGRSLIDNISQTLSICRGIIDKYDQNKTPTPRVAGVPIKPDEMPAAVELVPEAVIIAVNQEIRRKWNGVVASVDRDDVDKLVQAAYQEHSQTPPKLFSWVTKIQPIFTSAGWKVSYHNSSDFYTPYWTFAK